MSITELLHGNGYRSYLSPFPSPSQSSSWSNYAICTVFYLYLLLRYQNQPTHVQIHTLAPRPLPPQNPPPAPTMPDHPMRRLLDNGELTIRKRDREFTLFLDLNAKYHYEFITNLNDHVHDRGYAWPDMLEQENELKSCAREFVKRHGSLYWGSEKNRRKYLLPGSFVDSPEAMAVYPESKEE